MLSPEQSLCQRDFPLYKPFLIKTLASPRHSARGSHVKKVDTRPDSGLSRLAPHRCLREDIEALVGLRVVHAEPPAHRLRVGDEQKPLPPFKQAGCKALRQKSTRQATETVLQSLHHRALQSNRTRPGTGLTHSLPGKHDKGTTGAFRNGDKAPDGSQNREKGRKARTEKTKRGKR